MGTKPESNIVMSSPISMRTDLSERDVLDSAIACETRGIECVAPDRAGGLGTRDGGFPMNRPVTIHRHAINAVVVLVCIPGTGNAQFQKTDFDRVDAFVEAQLTDANIPGAAIGIVSRDEMLHLRGFGVAGPGPVPMTADTPFLLASLSKSITALAVMQLVEAGKVELDAPVRRYLPWFEVLPREDAPRITIRHLLNQTSGLSLRDGRLNFNSRDDSETALATGVRALAGARLRASPGEAFEYSNANYDVAGAIIEAVSGHTYEQYIESHVFAPLKMTNSFASGVSARQHDIASGHRYWFGRPVPIAPTSRRSARSGIASGGLFSSAADLARLLRVHLNGGNLDGERILSLEGMNVLHDPASFMTAKRHYAMGWNVQELNDGRKIMWHDGLGAGYASFMMLEPDQQWGFAFLVNASNQLSGPNVGALANEVRRLLMGQTPQPVRKAAGLRTPFLTAMAALLVLQLLAAVHTLQIARRWKRDPTRRPQGPLRMAWHFVLPAIAGVGLAIFLAAILPRGNATNLAGVRLFAPDAGLLIVTSVAFVCVWIPIRTGVLLRSMRHRGEPIP